MNKKNRNTSPDDKLAIGLSLELIFGPLLDNIALGLGTGLLFGSLSQF